MSKTIQNSLVSYFKKMNDTSINTDFLQELISISQRKYIQLSKSFKNASGEISNNNSAYVILWYGNGSPCYQSHHFKLEKAVISIAKACLEFYLDTVSDEEEISDNNEFITNFYDDRKIMQIYNIDKTKIHIFMDGNYRITNDKIMVSI